MNHAIERAYELGGAATLAILAVACVVIGIIICAPFMVLGWAGYRLGLVQ